MQFTIKPCFAYISPAQCKKCWKISIWKIWLNLPSPSSSGCPLGTWENRAGGLRLQRRLVRERDSGSVIVCYRTESNLNPYQSPLVQGDSRCSVDIGSGFKRIIWLSDAKFEGLSTWQRVGRWARSHCQVSHDGSRWQFQSGPRMALADVRFVISKNVKIKFQIE